MKNKRKKVIIFISLICFFNFSFASEQSIEIDNGDPCTVFLCMAGKVMGAGGNSECSKPEKTFFSIISKKHKKFNGGRTASARNSFLGQCKTADPEIVNKIIRKFGSVNW